MVSVAALQFSCTSDAQNNVERAEAMVRKAAKEGAQIILLQELFANLYFCQAEHPSYFAWAEEEDSSPMLQRFAVLAKELQVVLPISFFEKANHAYYNSIVIYDADGTCLGKYRKSHIPTGPGYQEKFYFNSGDTGFKVWRTAYACIGVAICWDQWFPEAARAMALAGADILFYPTAIGSEPQDPNINSREHWTRSMQGHSACNMVPVVASNRVGREDIPHAPSGYIEFYGGSFITDETGAILKMAEKADGEVLVASFDLEAQRLKRASWGLFRDRRPDLYTPLLTLDGRSPPK